MSTCCSSKSLPWAGLGVIAVLLCLGQAINESLQYQEVRVGYSAAVFSTYVNHSLLTVLWPLAMLMSGDQRYRSCCACWISLVKSKGWTAKRAVTIVSLLMIFYFIPNFGWAASLEVGSISMFTLIQQSMCAWVLVLDSLARKVWPNKIQICSVICSLAGVLCVAVIEEEEKDDSSNSENSNATMAIFWAIVFTVGLAIYQVFWGLHFDAKDNLSAIFTVLGAMGLVNALVMWPLIFLPHALGFNKHPFALPADTASIGCVILVAVISLLNNFAYMYGLAMTSPLFITVGYLLLLPISITMDSVIEGGTGLHGNPLDIVGSLLIIGGFLGLVWDESGRERTAAGGGKTDSNATKHTYTSVTGNEAEMTVPTPAVTKESQDVT